MRGLKLYEYYIWKRKTCNCWVSLFVHVKTVLNVLKCSYICGYQSFKWTMLLMHAFQIKCYQVYLQNVPYCNQALTYSISHSWTDLLLKICLKIFEAAFAYWNSLWVYHLIAFACTLVCEKQSWAELGLMMVISWWLALDGGLLRNCVSSPQWCRDDWLH